MVRFIVSLFCLFVISSVACGAQNLSLTIKGQSAKDAYLFLTGPHVDAEGAAGHLYKRGENIICKYVNADMDDAKGKLIPRQDMRRYSCDIVINRNGSVLKSKSV